MDQKSDALYAAVNCIQLWRYTRGLAWARKMWPFLTGVAEFWDHDLKLVNGRYTDLNDAEDEHLWGPAKDVNPATVIGFLNMLYPALIDISEQLKKGSDQLAVWQDILTHLSSLPIAPANTVRAITEAVPNPIPDDKMVILLLRRECNGLTFTKGDHFSANPPGFDLGIIGWHELTANYLSAWKVGLESPLVLRKAAINGVDYTRLWYDSNSTPNVYPAAASAGCDPLSILQHLNLMVTHLGH